MATRCAAPRERTVAAYTSVVSSLLFPLHERAKHHSSVAARRALEQTQWWPRERLVALQVERLRALLTEAGAHVPYYRALFAATGFDPARVTRLADLQRLPVLTKAIIRAHTDALKHEHASRLATSTTGGSSGEPLIFHIGKERVSHDVAAKWRATRWWGVDIGDRETVLWGSPIELGAQDRARLWRDRLFRSRLLSAFDMSQRNLDRFIASIRAFRPRMVFGYPYSLALLARHADERGVLLNDVGVKVVFVTSEQLYDDQRATIGRVFGCPVANGYGGRDAGFIAHECPAGGMHITAEDIIVELLDAEGRNVPVGEPGEVTVTHLASKDYPFVRYRTGDIAVLDDRVCPCGRGLPLLREIQGRTNDFLKALNGTPIPCGAFTYLLRSVPGIASFKIVQETIHTTRLMIVAGAGFEPASLDAVVAGFRHRLGESVAVDIELVPAIPKERSGKFRYIVSKVA